MKINVTLNLNDINLEYQSLGNIYTGAKCVRNLKMMFGDETDDFHAVAKMLFIAYNEDILEKEDVQTAIKLIEKDLIKLVLRHEFDF